MRMKGGPVSLIPAVAVLAAFFMANGCKQQSSKFGIQAEMPLSASRGYSNVLVTRAVDGDTLVLENGERVRLIGIDTPEVHESKKLYRDSKRSSTDVKTIKKLGRRAWDFTRRLTENKRVNLEFDIEKRDRYNRLLAYVYLKDGTFVNAEIVRQGYASLLTIPPNVKYADLFRKLYEEARSKNLGLWGD